MSSFLKTINTPSYNSNFANDLNNIISDINKNFQRLVSAPFIKGETGKNVTIVQEKLYSDTSPFNFTDLGYEIIKSIYNWTTVPTGVTNYASLVSYIDSNLAASDKITIGTDDYYSCEFLNQSVNKSINCYQIEDEQNKNFVSLYYFQDLRIKHLQGTQGISATQFNDRSCVLYGIYDPNDEWTINKYEGVPTIYWDNNIGSFCWNINGLASGINAQGIKGEQGEPTTVWSCHGKRYSIAPNEQNKCYIADVISCSKTSLTSPTVSDIEEGDVIYTWFKEDISQTIPQTITWNSSTDIVSNCSIGIAKKSGSYIYIEYNPFIDLRTITNNIHLRGQLDGIKYDNSDNTELRGLYVKMYTTTPANPKVHLLYETDDNSNCLNIGNVDYNYTKSDVSDPSLNLTDTSLGLNYTDIRSLPNTATPLTDPTNYHHRIYKDTINSKIIDDVISGNNSISRSIPSVTDTSKGSLLKIGINSNKNIYIGGNPGASDTRVIINPDNTLSTDKNPTYQQKQDSTDGTISITGNLNASDKYYYSNIFNFGGTVCNNGSAMNFRHIYHEGLSTNANLQFALCFNPKSSVFNDDYGNLILRLYTPSIQYLRDVSCVDTGSTLVNNWSGNGSLGKSQSTLSTSGRSEVFLYDKTDMVCNKKLTKTISNHNIYQNNIYTSHYINNYTENIINSNIGDNFFDIYFQDILEFINTNNANSVLIFNNTTPNDKLLNITLKNDIYIDNGTNSIKLGKNLPLWGIAIKQISSDNNTITYEFVYLFKINGTSLWGSAGSDTIISGNINNYSNSDKHLCIDTDPSSQIIGDFFNGDRALAINFVVKIDTLNLTSKIYPTTSNLHAAFANQTWMFNGSGSSNEPKVINFSWYFLSELRKNTTINTNRLFMPAPTVQWKDDQNNDYTSCSTISYSKKYDFYELGIGDTSITSRPKRELLKKSMSFPVTNNIGYIFLEDIQSDHDFQPYNSQSINTYSPSSIINMITSYPYIDTNAFLGETRSYSSSVINNLLGGLIVSTNNTQSIANTATSDLRTLEDNIRNSSTDIAVTNMANRVS